jgi:mannose-6-phosphate isomerase-like protein (cupin superfamily)
MKLKVSPTRTLFMIGIAGIAFAAIITSYLTLRPSTDGQISSPMSYHTNIVTDTQANENFRKVLFTGANSQLVVMSISPGGEVGKETHKYTEQTLFFLSGTGEGEFNGKKFPIVPGDVVVVTPGTEHNFRNTGTEVLKIYTVYAPPNHIDGRVHATKAAADADTADEAVGEVPPACIK